MMFRYTFLRRCYGDLRREHQVARIAARFAVLVSGLGLADATHAQQALVADRPDFTEGTTTVGLGVLQFELGYTFGVDDTDGVATRAHSYGEPLLRAGVFADRLELRVGAGAGSVSTESRGRTVTESGLEDLYLGVKLALSGQRGVLPATAILPQATVPTGGDAFSAGRVLPGVNFVYSWDFTESLSLAGGTQVNAAVADGNEDYREWAQSLSWAVALGERTGAYGEWYAFVPSGLAGGRAQHYLNSGLTWLANEDLQWDIRVGFGLNDAAEDVYVGTGVVFRIR